MNARDRLVRRVTGWLTTLGRRLALRGEPTTRSGTKLRLGREGERIAKRYLARQGYRIVVRNHRVPGGEIDLIAMDGETVVFIEVKTRTNHDAGTPEEAVDRRKQERIRHAAEIFVARYRAGDHPMRFDVVAISGRGRALKLEHIKDAF